MNRGKNIPIDHAMQALIETGKEKITDSTHLMDESALDGKYEAFLHQKREKHSDNQNENRWNDAMGMNICGKPMRYWVERSGSRRAVVILSFIGDGFDSKGCGIPIWRTVGAGMDVSAWAYSPPDAFQDGCVRFRGA